MSPTSHVCNYASSWSVEVRLLFVCVCVWSVSSWIQCGLCCCACYIRCLVFQDGDDAETSSYKRLKTLVFDEPLSCIHKLWWWIWLLHSPLMRLQWMLQPTWKKQIDPTPKAQEFLQARVPESIGWGGSVHMRTSHVSSRSAVWKSSKRG